MFVCLFGHLPCLFVVIVECAAFICIDTLAVTVAKIVWLSEKFGVAEVAHYDYTSCLRSSFYQCISIAGQ